MLGVRLSDSFAGMDGRDNALLSGGLDLMIVPGLGFTQVREVTDGML